MSFYDDVLEVAGRKLGALREKLLKLRGRVSEELARELWQELGEPDVQELGESASVRHVAGVDGGSFVPLSTLAFDLYVVKAYAIIVEEKAGRHKLAGEEGIVDVDFVVPPQESADRVNVYRDIGELKCALMSLGRSDLVLMDGSAESLVTRPTHLKLKHLDKLSSALRGGDRSFLESLGERELQKGLLATREHIERDLLETSPPSAAVEVRRVLALELAEKALALKLLLERVVAEGKKLVFITKTGRSHSIFKAPIPDQYVFSALTSKPGYYAPEHFVSFSHLGLPDSFGLRKAGEQTVLLPGFSRLAKGGPVLRIEVVAPKELAEKLGAKSLFLKTLGEISRTCVEGYPHPLVLAHQRAHIEKRAAEVVVEALGLKSFALTGREHIEGV